MRDWRPQKAADLPEGLVMFDGVCVLCSGSVKYIIPRDPEGRYRFVSIQSEFGRVLARRFGIDVEAPQSNVVIRDGMAWFKGDSALRVLRDLPGSGWTRVFWILPRPMRNFFYDFVARNRYRFFGKQETCFVPTPELRSRFLIAPDETA
jgi:predicted DCC family thiol-disulfide oxidoreductase YuxK